MTQCRRFNVQGQVQGVGFRASTQREATRLGLTGWVHNNADGSVEVLASGTEEALSRLQNWLWHGPGAARVAKVTGEAVAGEPSESDLQSFGIR